MIISLDNYFVGKKNNFVNRTFLSPQTETEQTIRQRTASVARLKLGEWRPVLKKIHTNG